MILLRSVLFNVYFFGLTLVLCFIGTAVRFLLPGRLMTVPSFWAYSVLAGLRVICGVRLQVTGLEQLPRGGAALIASQHQSAFDIMVWLTLLPRACYVVKSELTRIPLFGGMIRPAGMIVVDRKGGAQALRQLVLDTEQAAAAGKQVVIFPEGTRTQPGRSVPVQPGIAAMAAKTGLPIYPAVTDSGLCWPRRSFLKRPGTIHIALRPAIPPGLGRAKLTAQLNRIFSKGLGITL